MPEKLKSDWPPNDESFQKLSVVKKKILEILWSMEPVNTHQIHQATGQSYYDRRIRELREAGWQIETDGLTYRLISYDKLPGNIREYPSAKQKKEVFSRDKGICQICGSKHPRMEYDHKIPRERLGTTEVSNLQLLCSPCNVDKRGACKKCTLVSCEGCPYAYPELYKDRFVLLLDEEIANIVATKSEEEGIPKPVLILRLLKKTLQK